MSAPRPAARTRPTILIAGLLLIVSTLIAACGGDSENNAASTPLDAADLADAGSSDAKAQSTDQAQSQAESAAQVDPDDPAKEPEYPGGVSPDASPDGAGRNPENEGSGKVGPSAQPFVDPRDANGPGDSSDLDDPADLPPPAAIGDSERILIPGDHAAHDEFGWSADTDGLRAITGAPFHDDQGAESGAAYIFLRDASGDWREEAELLPDDGEAGAWFGRWTAIDGDLAVVGAPLADVVGNDDDAGAAYVFERIGGNWQQTARLVADLPKGGEAFGWNVDLDGDTIVVSASNDGDGGGQRVYVYRRDRDEWPLEAVLAPDDLAADFFFGQDIGIVGDTIVAGAKARDTAEGPNSGAVYVFERGDAGWTETATLIPDDPFVFDLFGRAVAIAGDPISGDTIVVGAYLEDEAGPDSGSVYVFQRDPASESGWRQDAKIVGTSTGEMDWFGYEVDTDGQTIIVGAPHTDASQPALAHAGLVTVFRRTGDGWVQAFEVRASDRASANENADYGWAVSAHGDVLMVGAWLADAIAGIDSGRAYIYTLPPPSAE